MYRREKVETFGEYVRRGYALRRDVRPETLRQYRLSVDLLERWAGGGVRLEELDEDMASAWLRDYAPTVAVETARGKRRMLLAVWRGASDDGLCAEPRARRVRRIRPEERVVTAWTREEVGRLLEAAEHLPRRHPCGLRRSQWWDLAIRVAWDSGLRWGDLVRLSVAAVGPDGVVSVVQSKTRKRVTFVLSPSTLAAYRQSLAVCPRSLVVPWTVSRESFGRQVALLVRKAGIRPGTWRWIRRGSGTDVEVQREGAGHRHLGNTAAVFDASYRDAAIVGRTTPAPRELLVAALEHGPRQMRLFDVG